MFKKGNGISVPDRGREIKAAWTEVKTRGSQRETRQRATRGNELGEPSERRAAEQDLRAGRTEGPDPRVKGLYTGDAAGIHAGPRSASVRSPRRHSEQPVSHAGPQDTEGQGFLAWRDAGSLERSRALSDFAKRCAIQNAT